MAKKGLIAFLLFLAVITIPPLIASVQPLSSDGEDPYTSGRQKRTSFWTAYVLSLGGAIGGGYVGDEYPIAGGLVGGILGTGIAAATISILNSLQGVGRPDIETRRHLLWGGVFGTATYSITVIILFIIAGLLWVALGGFGG